VREVKKTVLSVSRLIVFLFLDLESHSVDRREEEEEEEMVK
jgi:hypothetical protein